MCLIQAYGTTLTGQYPELVEENSDVLQKVEANQFDLVDMNRWKQRW